MTFQTLTDVFERAQQHGATYIGIAVQMEGFREKEIIINPAENFDDKLAYYKKTYDENLQHRFSPGISITDASYGNSFNTIEADLILNK